MGSPTGAGCQWSKNFGALP
uniref:Uncharacterized protein n=1 Tax=Rhizophora mucronata TaxID=61149 RepID=A0A2P2MHY1_RHIMU